MRKYVVGFLVGAALTLSVSVVAGTTSFVGKRIGAETEVYLDGQLFDTAAIVGGVSLAPLRKAYETAGYGVRFIDGKVYLESAKESEVMTTVSIERIDIEINSLKTRIANTDQSIAIYQKLIENSALHPEAIPFYEEGILGIEASRIEMEEQLAELERQKEELISR